LSVWFSLVEKVFWLSMVEKIFWFSFLCDKRNSWIERFWMRRVISASYGYLSCIRYLVKLNVMRTTTIKARIPIAINLDCVSQCYFMTNIINISFICCSLIN
jgi:hypothetical protein